MQKNIRDLFNLLRENPDLPVIAAVENEAVSDECGYSVASFGNGYIEEYAIYEDKYYDDREAFKEDYYGYHDDELCERFNYNPRLPADNEENNRNSILMDEYLNSIADRYFKKAIVVYIHTYEEE